MWIELTYRIMIAGLLLGPKAFASESSPGGRFIREHPQRRSMAYNDRNPAWLCAGIETDSPAGKVIQWTQPEILLYDDDTHVRMSYPDLVEENGETYVTETQKDIARVHRIDPHLLDSLWRQFDRTEVAQKGLLLAIDETNGPLPASVKIWRCSLSGIVSARTWDPGICEPVSPWNCGFNSHH